LIVELQGFVMSNIRFSHTLFLANILLSPVAMADGLAHVKWCETDTASPARAECTVQVMPDGNLRGTRSAATLIGEARAAARAGNCSKAIDWAAACQACHNPDAAAEIRAAADAVCGYLK
jgi:cytochrome c553